MGIDEAALESCLCSLFKGWIGLFSPIFFFQRVASYMMHHVELRLSLFGGACAQSSKHLIFVIERCLRLMRALPATSRASFLMYESKSFTHDPSFPHQDKTGEAFFVPPRSPFVLVVEDTHFFTQCAVRQSTASFIFWMNNSVYFQQVKRCMKNVHRARTHTIFLHIAFLALPSFIACDSFGLKTISH